MKRRHSFVTVIVTKAGVQFVGSTRDFDTIDETAEHAASAAGRRHYRCAEADIEVEPVVMTPSGGVYRAWLLLESPARDWTLAWASAICLAAVVVAYLALAWKGGAS